MGVLAQPAFTPQGLHCFIAALAQHLNPPPPLPSPSHQPEAPATSARRRPERAGSIRYLHSSSHVQTQMLRKLEGHLQSIQGLRAETKVDIADSLLEEGGGFDFFKRANQMLPTPPLPASSPRHADGAL
uniref:Uncharacterized protein n=1 Tax=Sphaerodactylus townsendi TaxID=933632 RepID=A0ACB8FSC5_9SAUR